LFAELRDTEDAHRNALIELEQMREQMHTMELERADMIADVEAQIERALQNMAVGIDTQDEEDYESEAASSVNKGVTGGRRRRSSSALKSLGTDATLVEPTITVTDVKGDVIEERAEEDEEQRLAEEEEEGKKSKNKNKKNRWSASLRDGTDGMCAVDEGITEKSDGIAAKVLAIQHKLESALTYEDEDVSPSSFIPDVDSGSECSEEVPVGKVARSTSVRTKASSAQREKRHHKHASITSTATAVPPTHPKAEAETELHNNLPSLTTADDGAEKERTMVAPSPTTPALTASNSENTTDDSGDDSQDFQSAYSLSPRGSYAGQPALHDSEADDTLVNVRPPPAKSKGSRSRPGTATSGTPRASGEARVVKSPTLSEDTVRSAQATY
jgi:EEF1A N-terminal glycine/lysine methyltransferase